MTNNGKRDKDGDMKIKGKRDKNGHMKIKGKRDIDRNRRITSQAPGIKEFRLSELRDRLRTKEKRKNGCVSSRRQPRFF